MPAFDRPSASVKLNYVIPAGVAGIENDSDVRNWEITYDSEKDTLRVSTEDWDSGVVNAADVDVKFLAAVTAYLALSYRRINDGEDPLGVEYDNSDEKDSLFS